MKAPPQARRKKAAAAGSGGARPVCIYVDNSNIFIGGREYAKAQGEDPLALRIDFENFLKLITGNTFRFDEMVWAGSAPEEISRVFGALIDQGVRVLMIAPSDKGENETVDMAIQLAMYRHARKYRANPGLMVLCTGDGKGYSNEEGFLYDVAGFAEDGWQLHLYSWDAVCHAALKGFAESKGRYVALEAHYPSITFLQEGRKAAPLKFSTSTDSSR